jgi:hypothetical protein
MKNIHNPNNVRVGDTVILDKTFNNMSKVVILGMTDKEVYSTVYDAEDPELSKSLPNWNNVLTWDVMTYRLSQIKS